MENVRKQKFTTKSFHEKVFSPSKILENNLQFQQKIIKLLKISSTKKNL